MDNAPSMDFWYDGPSWIDLYKSPKVFFDQTLQDAKAVNMNCRGENNV